MERGNKWDFPGKHIGPVLFLVFINDFPDIIEVLLKLFADDATIYNVISNINDVHQLQRTVTKAGQWSVDWEMLYSLKKYHQLHMAQNDMGFILSYTP